MSNQSDTPKIHLPTLISDLCFHGRYGAETQEACAIRKNRERENASKLLGELERELTASALREAGLRAALLDMLASATPTQKEQPRMYAAWLTAKAALASPAQGGCEYKEGPWMTSYSAEPVASKCGTQFIFTRVARSEPYQLYRSEAAYLRDLLTKALAQPLPPAPADGKEGE